jgi:coenzyme Q-binding protein COQ10
MPTYSETRVLPYSPQQLFALVIDIERYPEFLPWCRAARIISRETDSFLGELIISFNHLTERYTSRVTPVAPIGAHEGTIEVSLVQGPFKFLDNHWRFVPHADGCELHFGVDFEFKSKLLNSLIGGVFTRASEKMVGAFLTRAEALYGKHSEPGEPAMSPGSGA